MDVGTQTPREFYTESSYPLLTVYGIKIKKLERQLQKKRATSTPKDIQIGPYGTQVSKKMYQEVDWSCPKKATRMLSYLIFGRETLGTHTLTGRSGRGTLMYNTPKKPHLPRERVKDIVHHIVSKFGGGHANVLEAIRQTCFNSARYLKTIKARKERRT